MEKIKISMLITFCFMLPLSVQAVSTSLEGGISDEEANLIEMSEPLKDELVGREKARSLTEFDWMVKIRDEALKNEMEKSSELNREAVINQNRAKLACFSLVAMMDLVGQVGEQVAKVGQEIDSTLDVTLQAETSIRLRTGIKRLLWGGEAETAKNLLSVVEQNETKAKKLRDLQAQSDAPAENIMMIGIQAKQIEQEQARLRLLAEKELNSKGLIGWIKGLFS